MQPDDVLAGAAVTLDDNLLSSAATIFGGSGNTTLVVDHMSNSSAVTLDGGLGNEIFKVRNASRNEALDPWSFLAGGSTAGFDNDGNSSRDESANWLMVESGNAYVQSSILGDGTRGLLDGKVVGSATLLTKHLRQNRFFVFDTTQTTIKSDGTSTGTSIVDNLTIRFDTGARFDVTNNDLILRTTAATKTSVLSGIVSAIKSAWNGVDANFVTNWSGAGLTSSTARTTNLGAGFDLVALGAIRNSDLDVAADESGHTYSTFSGQAVTFDYVLVKFTYTGDANLDGAVTFDDYAAMDSAQMGLIPNLGWATGDVNYDNAINFDDYGVVDQAFYFQGPPL
jgi:hypothetical protein